MAKKHTTSTFGRSLRLLGMAGQLAAKELTLRIGQTDTAREIKTRVDQARVLADQLSQLKGAAMKAGQLLSLDTSDFLPKEAVEVLSKLQSKAEAYPFEDIYRVFTQELSEEKIKHFSDFSTTARAAASIGQLHSATLNGQKVAIKIQYPGVAESIDSDLAILRRVAQGFLQITGKKIPLEETFQELGKVLHRETDYEIERLNLEKYALFLKDNPQYIVPKTFPDYSTKKILVMSWEEGMHIQDWLDTKPSTADREELAALILELFCMEFLDWGFVQTDPNFANFLIRPKPLQLVCLDFGATLSYDETYRKGYSKLLVDLNRNTAEELFKSAVDFGLLDPRETLNAQKAFKTMVQVAMEPFQPQNQPFRFSDPTFEKRTIEANLAFSRELQYSPPPRKLLFLHRKLGGIFNLVKKMGVTLSLTPYWQKMTSKATSE